MLDLQAQDSTLAQLTHRKKSLPEHAAVDELMTSITELDRRRVEHETTVSDLTRDQKKADAEVEHVKLRRTRDHERMASGQISNPKDLASMQHEIVALDRRIGTLEDEELEIMEALEAAQGHLDAVLAELAQAKNKLEETQVARDRAVEDLDAQAGTANTERDQLAVKVPNDLIGLYEKVRAHSGTGAAALRQRRCEGCRLEINGADLREIATMAEDEVLRCPECNRILVRTPESGLG